MTPREPFPKMALLETQLIEIPSASAIASTISKPTLWRVPLYILPGLPRPTMSHGFGLGFIGSTATSDGEAVTGAAADGCVVEAEEDEDWGIVIDLRVLLLEYVEIRVFEEGEEE